MVVSPICGSPHLHAAIDDDVDPGYVRALFGGEEQRDVRDLLGLAAAAPERLAEHLAGPLGVAELRSRRVGLDQTWRDRIRADAMLPTLHCQLAGHADDPRL